MQVVHQPQPGQARPAQSQGLSTCSSAPGTYWFQVIKHQQAAGPTGGMSVMSVSITRTKPTRPRRHDASGSRGRGR